MNNKYDYLIVGAGLFGSTFAYEMTKAGKKCLIIESKKHIAGNCYTEKKDRINIHTYGPHIFHTNDKGIWEWVNQFAEFNNYRHCVRVSYDDKMYSFPINLMTLNQLWNVKTPEEAKTKLKSVSIPNDNPQNLEEWILSQVGEDIYKTFVKGYTTKQWGKSPKELPTIILKGLSDNTFNYSQQKVNAKEFTMNFHFNFYDIEFLLNRSKVLELGSLPTIIQNF